MENGSDGGVAQTTSGRGRGRPRASYAQTGELDLSLIREYKNRPSLYDRNSKRFKDKVFTAQQWQVISHKLGYDVSLLKDRMLQLRNRYNIEKRRVEQYNEENPSDKTESPWPLYGSLNFLSSHIRSRRSYKSFEKVESSQGEGGDDTYDMMGEEGINNTGLTVDEDDEDGGGGGGVDDNDNEEQMSNTEAPIDVKVELETSSSDEEYESNPDPECELPVSTVPKIIIKSMRKSSANTSSGPTSANGQQSAHFGIRQNDVSVVKISPSSSEPTSPNQKNGVHHKLTLRRVENMSSSVGSSSKYMPITPQQQHLAHFNLGSNNFNQRSNTSSTVTANVVNTSNATNSFNNKRVSPAMSVPNSNSNSSNNKPHPPKLKRNNDHHNGNGGNNTSSNVTTAASSSMDSIMTTVVPTDESSPPFHAKRPRINSSLTSMSGRGGGCHRTDNGHLLAFGDFVGRTLCQLHPDVALQFIPKFTNELVQALLHQDSVNKGGHLNTELLTRLPNYSNGGGGGSGGGSGGD